MHESCEKNVRDATSGRGFIFISLFGKFHLPYKLLLGGDLFALVIQANRLQWGQVASASHLPLLDIYRGTINLPLP